MADGGFKRKLTAVLSADAVGYSRLMGDNEEATVRTLTAYREVLSALIHQHNGKVLDSPGDNLMAEFVSVVDAVQCAVAVQKEIKARNDHLPGNRKMQFRIGINLGDVIEEGERIYGDGVNIAARLEGLAEPGGICISKTAFDHIESKLPYGYDFIGDQTVKNIAKPVAAYRVLMDPRVTVGGKPVDEKPAALRRMPILVGVVAVLVLAAMAGIWQFDARRLSIEPDTIEKMAFTLPDKPSIAVLPFTNLSGEPEQEFISDGFTEDIIVTLAKMPRMFVIAPESSFTFKGKSVKIQEIGRNLGVRYILEGSIQKSGERIRISAKLIDAKNGQHLWTEKFDRDQKNIFQLRDDIIKEIAIALQIKLTEGEWVSGWMGITNNFDAWAKVKQSLEHFRRFTPDDNILSRQKAKEALKLDPKYSGAMQMTAWTLLMDGPFGTSKTPDKSIEQAFELAQKALDKGDDDAGAHYLLGFAYLQKGQVEKAVSSVEIALDLFPNSAEINAGLGMILSDAGRPKEAIPPLKKAMRLNPYPPSWYYSNLGSAYRETEQCEKAILEYKKAIQQQPDFIFAHLNLAICYVRLSRQEDAHTEAAEVLRIDSKFSGKRVLKAIRFKDQAAKQRYIDDMRKLGLPE